MGPSSRFSSQSVNNHTLLQSCLLRRGLRTHNLWAGVTAVRVIPYTLNRTTEQTFCAGYGGGAFALVQKVQGGV